MSLRLRVVININHLVITGSRIIMTSVRATHLPHTVISMDQQQKQEKQ